MPRLRRVVVPQVPHHVTQRGNRRTITFGDDQDRELYLRTLRQKSLRHDLRIWAYTLMTNHVHLVVVPERSESLSRAIQELQSVYARFFNAKYGLVGHLWHGRFFSCVLDEPHLWAAVRYVELNPVRAGIVSRAEDYKWSSAKAHCGHRSDALLDTNWPPPGAIEDWSSWLQEGQDQEGRQTIRQATRTGRPCGSDEFTERIELKLGRTLRLQPAGRKPRTRK